MLRAAALFRFSGASSGRALALSVLGTLLVWAPRAAAQVASARAVKPALAAKATQLQLPSKSPEQLRVESVSPTLQAPVVTAGPRGGASIAVRSGDQLVIHETAEAQLSQPVKLAAKVKGPLPSTLVVGVRNAENGTTVARTFKPFLSVEISPLRWEAEVHSYITTVLVGLDPLPGDPESDSVVLPASIRFQLSGENVEKVDPPDVDVSEAGTHGYRRFKVLTKQFDRPVRVTAHSSFGDKQYEASVEPGPSFFRLGQSTASVDGFGLGKATISLSQRAANSQLLPSPSGLRVQLTTSKGFLVPSHVDLPAQGASGETSLVSSTWGEATVGETNADSPEASRVTIVFAFPWLKFALGLIGAGCAGALRVVSAKRDKRRGWLPVFIGCVASGITIDILAALGAPIAPDWLLAMIRNELAWFAIGLIAGYPGVAVVGWAGEKLFGFKKGEPASTG